MKNIRALISVMMFVLLPLLSLADGPPPPPGQTGGGPGGGATPVGAPIDGGLGILIALGAAYGAVKIYQMKKVQATEMEE
jgi:hypothetical protein